MKNYRSRIFDFKTIKRPVEQGSLLVSEPFLQERYFKHAVISLVDLAADNGTMGVVLNNRTGLMLHEVVDEIKASRQVNVYCGGPLSHDRLFFLHTLGPDIVSGASEYAPGLYIGGDFASVVEYVNSGYPMNGVLRFFIGYTGWSPGQLAEELDNDVWAVANPDAVPAAVLLSNHGDTLWHTVVRTMGPDYRLWRLHPMSTRAN